MKRSIAAAVFAALLMGCVCGCGATEETASVESVAVIAGLGPVGVTGRYAGKVVSGQTAEIKKDADKTVLEVYVAEGDMVKEGDLLFSYDTEAMRLSLDKLYLEKESYENTISAAQSEISELERQRANASSSQQLSYTLQIDSRGADIREAQYNLALKERDIAAMEAAMENTDIASPLAGRVMSVNDDDSASDPSATGDAAGAFITVMDVGAYRVQGQINELNVGALSEGMRVLIRSRTDAQRTWPGVIDSVDWENPVSGSSQSGVMIVSANDEMASSTKYPFYVALDSTEDLLLGQHVYIEPDLGAEGGSGLMLPAYYVVDGAWVWAASAGGKLEKRALTLGSYDEAAELYEIVGGLDASDYIAFPAEDLREGMTVTYYDQSGSGGDEVPGGYEDLGGYADYGAYEDLPQEGAFPAEAYDG